MLGIRRLIPIAVVLVTVVTFAHSLENGFTWDDKKNLVNNVYYRGLGPSELAWMFTGFHMGHYAPVTWITFGLDYLIWGLNPAGYHLTNVLLHAANAVLVYFLACRLLAAAAFQRTEPSDGSIRWAGALAALLFAVHPLRVESVAWATERRDVLSAFFYLAAILAYVRVVGPERSQEARRWIWYGVALGLHGLALLSKSMAVSLPIVLVVLDVYPLRRLGGPSGWLGRQARAIYLEKLPFVALSAGASLVAVIAARSTGITLAPLAALGVVDRFAISAYSLGFYLLKTVVPVRLAPLYELESPIEPWTWPYLLSAAAVVVVTLVALVRRHRWPALAAVWIVYAAILAPVVGIVQNGPQIAADRYTYLACLGWALLASGLLIRWTSSRPDRAPTAIAGALLAALVLASLAWQQVHIWKDSERLWRHAIESSPSAIGHHNLGVALLDRGALAEASIHFRETIQRQPGNAVAHNHLGVALARGGDLIDAIDHFRKALAIEPGFALAEANLGRALNLQRESEAARTSR
jgi:protein O-mannosyl-transferase